MELFVMTKVRYGGVTAEATPAAGARGVLCKSAADGSYFFRVKEPNGDFTDYELRHDDLEVVISEDALASFYKVRNKNILDHSPKVLGLKEE
jgi:hypothetical protein